MTDIKRSQQTSHSIPADAVVAPVDVSSISGTSSKAKAPSISDPSVAANVDNNVTTDAQSGWTKVSIIKSA